MTRRAPPFFLLLATALWLASPASAAESRPSIVLIVVDTLRRDAVSAYGEIAGTTPEMDALAKTGLRYERAYAPAPWTLPSHATILSGLAVEQHRVGLSGGGAMPSEIVTVAERLSAAGYETAAFSENPVVSETFGLVQGFRRHRATRLGEADGKPVEIDAANTVANWLPTRDKARPYFLFVNLFDPHHPYDIRPENRFVPAGTSLEEIKTRPNRPNRLICSGVPEPRTLATLRGLYLGDVQEADAKVGRIVASVRAATAGQAPIVIVASDHGEYFGEERLMGHEFGLHEVVLHVPLIVSGLPGVAPSVIADTVGLVDLAPTILGWAGVAVPREMPGRPLPRQSGGEAGDRAIFAFYSDATHWQPASWREHGFVMYDPDNTRQFCSESDPVWGSMAAVIQYPYKFVWYQKRKPVLFDLSWDRAQKSDQAAFQPAAMKRFERALAPRVRESGLDGSGKKTAPEMSQEARDALKALGYSE
jgi:arylsulfatase A-like enzyme